MTTWSFAFVGISNTKTIVFRVRNLEEDVDTEIDMYGLTDVLIAAGYPGTVIADAMWAAIERPGTEVGIVKGARDP